MLQTVFHSGKVLVRLLCIKTTSITDVWKSFFILFNEKKKKDFAGNAVFFKERYWNISQVCYWYRFQKNVKQSRAWHDYWGKVKFRKKKKTQKIWNVIVCGEEHDTMRTCLLLLLASKLISPLAVPQRFFFPVPVTWGSIWAKIQGVLKKGTPRHQDTHIHTLTTTNTVTELEWGTKTNQKEEGQLVSPQMPKIMPFSPCSWRSCCTITGTALMLAKKSLRTFPLWQY